MRDNLRKQKTKNKKTLIAPAGNWIQIWSNTITGGSSAGVLCAPALPKPPYPITRKGPRPTPQQSSKFPYHSLPGHHPGRLHDVHIPGEVRPHEKPEILIPYTDEYKLLFDVYLSMTPEAFPLYHLECSDISKIPWCSSISLKEPFVFLL